jgi:hypothetical protein
LVTHSAPTIRRTPRDPYDSYIEGDDEEEEEDKDAEAERDDDEEKVRWRYWEEPGTVSLWKWLGLVRFFPHAQSEGPRPHRVTIRGVPQERFRGCASVCTIYSPGRAD